MENIEEQNNSWNNLSDEEKKHYQISYNEWLGTESGVPNLLEELFGKHNLLKIENNS